MLATPRPPSTLATPCEAVPVPMGEVIVAGVLSVTANLNSATYWSEATA